MAGGAHQADRLTGVRLREAMRLISAGDLEGHRLMRRLTGAGQVPGPGEEADPEVRRTSELLHSLDEARRAGDDVQAVRLRREVTETCSPGLVEALRCLSSLDTGIDRGWLPAADHDRLTAWDHLGDLGLSAVIERIERIERRTV
ncbi:hypothetical protein [Actinomadura sp. HBU206391]|uniref:hypothetical protein n=1 Tax=Actinomadura sp. HBU206391 TaxID=2731692 RepID=UPI001650C494|nr:hypothetical protein [Actinomadura sp. HBU206391]MBC6461986.1 hypothetical protein [Actinomadura sp. HBU206391]